MYREYAVLEPVVELCCVNDANDGNTNNKPVSTMCLGPVHPCIEIEMAQNRREKLQPLDNHRQGTPYSPQVARADCNT